MEAEAEAAAKNAAKAAAASNDKSGGNSPNPRARKKTKLGSSCDTILTYLAQPPVCQTLQFVDLRFSDFSSDMSQKYLAELLATAPALRTIDLEYQRGAVKIFVSIDYAIVGNDGIVRIVDKADRK